MIKSCYRNLRNYKYQLVSPYRLKIGITGFSIATPYIRLDADGNLEIAEAYAWDGPSGPTIDTADFMRGSLVHDTLYQLIRLEALPYSYKEYADLLLKKICLEDGMSKFRAGYVFFAVKHFGGASARPGSQEPAIQVCVPESA